MELLKKKKWASTKRYGEEKKILSKIPIPRGNDY